VQDCRDSRTFLLNPQIEQFCASGRRAVQAILFAHPTLKADLCVR
jgi:hypothetical protein